jgi:hypothetical protein
MYGTFTETYTKKRNVMPVYASLYRTPPAFENNQPICTYVSTHMIKKTRPVFFVVKGPAADATDAPQPSGFLYNPRDEDEVFFYQVLQLMEHHWNEIDRGKPTTRRKTCPSATLSITNPTWTDPGSNSGLRGERPATNRLSHGTA